MRRELNYFGLLSECNQQAAGSKGARALALKTAYGLLLAMSLLTLTSARVHEPKYTLEPAERYFEQVMTRLQRGLKSANNSCISLSQKIDRLVRALAQEAKRDPKLVKSIKLIFRTDQLDEDALGGHSRHKRSLLGVSPRPSNGLLGVLSAPSVVQAQAHGRILQRNHQLDKNKFKKQVSEQFTRLPRYDQDQWIQSIERIESNTQLASKRGLIEEYNVKDEDKPQKSSMSKLTAIKHLIDIAAQMGPILFDHFYAPPNFLYDIPVIGKRLLTLRRIGEPIFHLSNALRLTLNIYKIRNGQEMIGPDGHVQSEEDTVKLIKESGLLALRSISELVLTNEDSKTREKIVTKEDKEFKTRMFYGVVTFTLDNKELCL